MDSKIIVTSIKLRDIYQLTYFDSLHAASSMYLDSIILSSDKDYLKLSHLKTIEPKDYQLLI